VFTTFEGENHVLMQLVAKGAAHSYGDDIKGMSPVEMGANSPRTSQASGC